MEKWKDINGYVGLYQISSNGRVKSIHPRGGNRNGKGKVRTGKEHYLTPSLSTTGYFKVCLVKNHKKKDEKVHRLVATAFIPNPENKPNINHKDGNKTNNTVTNLEWCTQAENVKHAWSTGLRKMTPLTKECLIELYIHQHKSIQEIAKIKRTGLNRVKKHLEMYDIEPHKGKKYEIPICDLKDDIAKGLRNKELAKKYKCSYDIIATRKYQIKKGII